MAVVERGIDGLRYVSMERGEWEQARAQIAALRSELAAYRELPLVPLQDHQRVTEQRDAALRQLDSMAAEIQRLRDGKERREHQITVSVLARVMQTLSKMAGSPEEREAWQAAWARLFEMGERVL